MSIDMCVACGSDALAHEREWHGYEIVACGECGLSMTANPDYSRERYVAAYAGASDRASLPAEHIYTASERRLALELSARIVPPPQLTPAERHALAWIERHAPAGGRVVDCGCGAGRFLRALQRKRIAARGFELSADMVAKLQLAGLDAAQGAAPDFAWAGPAPFAITFFEVLEHLPQPAAFLAPLRERFPDAHILASVPSPRRVAVLKGARQPVDYPPNHFLRWTPEALEAFFDGLGFGSVRVEIPPPPGSDVMPGASAALRRFARGRAAGGRGTGTGAAAPARTPSARAATVAVVGARAYQGVSNLVGLPAARRWAGRGASASSMLVIASP